MPSDLKDRLLAKVSVNAETGCWEWTAGKDKDGYGLIWHTRTQHRAHRVSFEIHWGRIPAGVHVLHSCDNPRCINPAHLFLGSHEQNMADRKAKGRVSRGAKHKALVRRGETSGRAKLTGADVIAIRAAEGVTQQGLANKYGVSRSNIQSIRAGKHWAHIQVENSHAHE